MMTRNHALVLLIGAMLIIAGCQQTSIAEQEQIRNLETIQAGTPSPTPTATTTPTPEPSATSTPTVGPTPTATPTPPPTLTPLPPTPTPNPALAKFSLCNQTAGDVASGRFSAQLTTITTTVEPAFERMTLAFDVPADSVAPHALARCLSAAAVSDAAPATPYLLRVNLDGWLHDDLFRSSALTRTIELSGTSAIKSAVLRADPSSAAGATLEIGLEQPVPFRLALQDSPPRLVLEVAKTSPVGPGSDTLTVASQGNAAPAAPIYYIKDGDIWAWQGGSEQNLTKSPEVETSLDVSQSAKLIAFCRAAPGTDVGDALATSSLWIMGLDGSDAKQLAAPGRSCADPAFSPDSKQIAFTVNEGTANPPRLSIYLASVSSGGAALLTAPGDEWSRYGPDWLGNNRLVYAASSEDGRSTLFTYDIAAKREDDIGAALVVGDRYSAVGRPLVGPDGTIAVEARRASGPGADMVLLDANGAEKDTVGAGYWTRPLDWGDDGTLYYMTTECASEATQSYELHARPASGGNRLLATGITTGTFGGFTAVSNGLAYVALERAAAGPRGALSLDRASSSALWFWDVANGPRAKLVESQRAITDLTR